MPLQRNELAAWLARIGPFEDPTTTGRPAAVLVPIAWNEEKKRDEILLTKRTETVQSHKGQVSFPGGMWESSDRDLKETALRETGEEIGIDPRQVDVVGRLPLVLTRGSLPIVPWVGLMPFPAQLTVNVREVASTLWLPVERLLEEGLSPTAVPIGQITVQSPGIYVEGELVWGATARILEMLRGVLMKRGLP